MADSIQQKLCRDCQQLKPVTDFTTSKRGSFGRESYCRPCSNARHYTPPPVVIVPGEEWRAVPGYEGLYEASNLGRVRNIARRVSTYPGRILKGGANKDGRVVLSLFRNARRQAFSKGNVIARTFIGPPPSNLHEVNHIDGNPANDLPSNLEWVTESENHIHALQTGLRASGERHRVAKLTDGDVVQIRHLLKTVRGNVLAKQFGVSKSVISVIKNSKSWRYPTRRSS